MGVLLVGRAVLRRCACCVTATAGDRTPVHQLTSRAARAVVAWTVANPALAQLMFWRPVPGFEPSPEVFHDSVTEMVEVQAELAEAVQRGELVARAADADAVRLFTIVLSGVISQQMANEPSPMGGDSQKTRPWWRDGRQH